jgi:hypothetical protein
MSQGMKRFPLTLPALRAGSLPLPKGRGRFCGFLPLPTGERDSPFTRSSRVNPKGPNREERLAGLSARGLS